MFLNRSKCSKAERTACVSGGISNAIVWFLVPTTRIVYKTTLSTIHIKRTVRVFCCILPYYKWSTIVWGDFLSRHIKHFTASTPIVSFALVIASLLVFVAHTHTYNWMIWFEFDCFVTTECRLIKLWFVNVQIVCYQQQTAIMVHASPDRMGLSGR